MVVVLNDGFKGSNDIFTMSMKQEDDLSGFTFAGMPLVEVVFIWEQGIDGIGDFLDDQSMPSALPPTVAGRLVLTFLEAPDVEHRAFFRVDVVPGLPVSTCGPQKVYPALITRFRPAMVHCFWPIFFCGSQVWLAQLLPPRRCIGVRTRQTDGTDGLEESSAWASLPQSQCSVVWSPRNFDNASRIRSFRSVRVFGNNANRVFESYVRARHQPR